MSIYSIAEISERVKSVAERYDINKITLFGSYARGEANEDSDIDLMLSYNELKGLFALGGILVDFKEVLGKALDIVSEKSLTSKYATSTSKKLYENIKKEGVMIYAKEN